MSEDTIFIKEKNEWKELSEEHFDFYRVVCPVKKDILKVLLENYKLPITLIKKQQSLPLKEYECNMYQVEVFDDCCSDSMTSTDQEESLPCNSILSPERSVTPFEEDLRLSQVQMLVPTELTDTLLSEDHVIPHCTSPEVSSVCEDNIRSISTFCQEIHNELLKLDAIDTKWMELCGKSFMKFSSDVNIHELQLEKLSVTDLSDIIRNMFHPSTQVKNIPLKAYNVLKSRNKTGLINYIRSTKKIKSC